MTTLEIILFAAIIYIWFNYKLSFDLNYIRGFRAGFSLGRIEGRDVYDEEVYERGYREGRSSR